MFVVRCLFLIVLVMGGTGCAACHTCDDCDTCPKVCTPESKTGEETHKCWDVECEDVCIPAVACPGDDCCERRCGRVRRVAVLTQKEEKRDACEYDWTIHALCPTCQQRHPGQTCNGDPVSPVPAPAP